MFPMNQITENRFDEDLRRLEHRFHFRTGQVRLERDGQVFLHVRPKPAPDVPDRHVVTLSKNLRPAREVRQLPCGVLRGDGELVATAWTDELGQAEFSLIEGDYALRYVWNVEQPIDAQILGMIGDDLARECLSDCLEDDELPPALRESVRTALDSVPAPDELKEAAADVIEIARELAEFERVNEGRADVRPVAAPALRRLAAGRFGVWRRGATLAGEFHGELSGHSADTGLLRAGYRDDTVHESLAAYSDDERPPAESDEDWLVIQGGEIVVQVPADQVPYGVVRIAAQQGEQLVGTCLLPLVKYGDHWRYNTCSVDEVLRDRDPRTVDWYVQPALLAKTLPWFPAAKVRKLLDRPDVQSHEELRQRIELLLTLAEERETEA
jgi:hypothetical protein